MPILQDISNDRYIDFKTIDVTNLNLGYQIIDQPTGNFWVLVASPATVDHTSVESVLGRPDLRWVATGQNAGTPIGTSVWLNLSNFYVSTLGSDANNGKSETAPKLSIKAGLQAVVANGGGTLYIDDGCVCDPNNGNVGIWLRGDTFAVPGFVNIPSCPIRIIGLGKTTGVGPFLNGPQALFTGGGGRHAPNLWVVGPLNSPVWVQGLQPAHAHQVGARVGVDYDRNSDGTERAISVSTATRTGTTTVLTVTLPTGVAVTTGISDVAGNVTLTIPNPSLLPWPPFKGTGVVRVTSTNVNFASGDYTVNVTSNFVTSPIPSSWTLTYNDGGSTRASQSMTGSTVQSHGCCAGDFLDLTVTTGDFLGTQYLVNSVTATTITVTDIFGHGNVTTANIGTLVHQERFAGGTSMYTEYQCGFGIDNTDPGAGPSHDIGHTAAISPVLDSCWITGYVGAGQTSPRDELRMAAVMVSPGSSGALGPGVAGITSRHCRGAGGAIYALTTGNGTIDVRDHTVETTFQALGLPALKVVGTIYTTVYGEDIGNADSQNATVSVAGCDPSGVILNRCGGVSGSCIGGDSFQVPSSWRSQSGTAIDNPWIKDQGTVWADLRSSFKHPGSARAMGVVGARFDNVILPPSGWSPHGTLTTGIEAPDGSLTAVQLNSVSTGYSGIKPGGTDGSTWTAGGYLVFCGWINALSPLAFSSNDGIRVVTSDITFEPSIAAPTGVAMIFPYFGKGWQFVSMKMKVATVASTTPVYILDFYAAGTSQWQLWGLTSFYVPNTGDGTSFVLNDIAEYMGTLKHQPYYLQKGMSGTMEGTKLIAHGGLGIDTTVPKVAGVGSGQLTVGSITTYEPRYAANGTTVIGWAPLYAATINP